MDCALYYAYNTCDFLILPISQQDFDISPLFCGFALIMIHPIPIWVFRYKPLNLSLANLSKITKLKGECRECIDIRAHSISKRPENQNVNKHAETRMLTKPEPWLISQHLVRCCPWNQCCHRHHVLHQCHGSDWPPVFPMSLHHTHTSRSQSCCPSLGYVFIFWL